MDISFAVMFFVIGAVTGGVIVGAWFCDYSAVDGYEPTEDGRAPL
jgi:hypothetical protein